MKTKTTFLFFLLILLWSKIFYAQNNISIKTKVDSTLIGYDIPLEIDTKGIKTDSFKIECLNFNQTAKIYLPKLDTSVAKQLNEKKVLDKDIPATDFEISDFGQWDGKGHTIFPKGNNKNKVKIRVWDEGQYIIIPVIILQNDTILPENPDDYPSITILSGINPQDTLKNITPVKEIIREKTNWKDFIWIYIIIAIIILIGLALWLLPKLINDNKKGFSAKETVTIIRPVHEIALEKLQKLQKEKIWKQGKVKQFQSELTYILREYIENRYNFNALEQTTGEIIDSLQKINLKPRDIESIKNILQIADMVKFAKAKPEEDINQKFLDETIDFVSKTKLIYNKENLNE